MQWFGGGGLGLVACVVSLAVPSSARADEPAWPVAIYSTGPEHVRVRVATGAGLPCSSTLNRVLFEGFVEPEQTVLLRTPEVPICVEHTYGAFPDTEWSPPLRLPAGCRVRGPCGLPPVIRVVI